MIPERLKSVKYAWLNGELTPFAETKVHVFTPGFRYGLGVMEGLRAYWNEERQQLNVVLLEEHFQRLQQSAKLMRYQIGYDYARTLEIFRQMIQANGFKEDLHMRHYVYPEGFGAMETTDPVGSFVVAYPRGRLHDTNDGMHCCISSWVRIADNAFPPRVKLGGNYNNSRLAKLEAKMNGYDDGIMLTAAGKVSEASASSLLLIRGGELVVPSRTSGVLEGITRNHVIDLLAREKGLRMVEREVDRTELYIAEEVFTCGTGAEVVPIVSIDRLPVADGKPGPLTRWLQERYFSIVRGQVPEYLHWLTPMYV